MNYDRRHAVKEQTTIPEGTEVVITTEQQLVDGRVVRAAIPHVHTMLRPSPVRSDEIEVKATKLEIHSHERRNPQGGLLLALKLEPLLNPLRDFKGEMWNDYIVVLYITSCHSGI